LDLHEQCTLVYQVDLGVPLVPIKLSEDRSTLAVRLSSTKLLVFLVLHSQRLGVPFLLDRDIPVILLEAAPFTEACLGCGYDEFTTVLADHPRVLDTEACIRHSLDAFGINRLATYFTGSSLERHGASAIKNGLEKQRSHALPVALPTV
jgi:hypothetical protein